MMMLDFATTNEVLFLVYHIDRLLMTLGADLLSFVQFLKKQGKMGEPEDMSEEDIDISMMEEDVITSSKLSIVLCMIMLLKKLLIELYDIPDQEIREYNPNNTRRPRDVMKDIEMSQTIEWEEEITYFQHNCLDRRTGIQACSKFEYLIMNDATAIVTTDFDTTDHATIKPLEGIRVLELGQIKIEPPKTGDPLRKWRGLDHDGQSPWFRSMARNKKSVCIDLRSEEGRKLVKQLALKSDVLIENFKPGTMEKWGLGPENIYPENPKLVYTRISGYGQTGPYSKKPGFASVCEGMGGFRFINGHPGQPPVRPNLSLGDSLAGMHAALGTLLGLIARNKLSHQSRTGQVVDVAIYESMFNMMEGIVPEYDRFQEIRQPSGTTLTGIVPTNTYPCQDGKHVIIGGNGDSIYVRLMNAIGRPDLVNF
ncbi:hypothetical protein G6F56_008170 [Rhizopus delemar]|nr:hypothetical protein G6F56_008170 [Rhizopus delemar]